MASHGQSGPRSRVMEGDPIAFGYITNNVVSTAAPRNSILNPNDQAFMDGFWDAPGTMSSTSHQDTLILNGFTMNEPAIEYTGFDLGGEGGSYTSAIGIESGTGGESYGGGFPHLGSSSYHDMFNEDSNDTSTSQQPESEGQAASALMNMSTNQHQQSAHNPQSGIAWGNMIMATGVYNDSMQQNAMNTSSATATPTTPTQPHVSQLSRQMPAQPFHTRDFMRPPAEKISSSNPHVRRASAQQDLYQMPAGQQQQWTAPQSPAHFGQGMSPTTQYGFGTDNNFNPHGYKGHHRPSHAMPIDKSRNLVQGLNIGDNGSGAVLPRASMSSSQAPASHVRVQQQSSQRMSASTNLQTLTNAASARHYQENSAPNTSLPSFSGQWPPNSAMNNNSQPSRKRTHSESEGQETSQSIAAPARRGPAVPKEENLDEPSNQASLITPPGSTKRRRSNATRPDTGSSVSSPSTPAELTQALVLKRRRTDPKQSRANLSDIQKRENHIKSEQKRRDAMKTNFAELNMMVPSLHKGTHGLSRSDILQRAADYLEMLTVSNKALLTTYGITESALSEFEDEDDDGEEEEADDDVAYIARGNAEGVTTYG